MREQRVDSEREVVVGLSARDCPECLSAGSITNGMCQVCLAEFGERGAPGHLAPPIEPVEGELRFEDVVGELRAAASLARESRGEPASHQLVEACRRIEDLLAALRRQFHHDLGLAPRA